jgi:hypothetical protein
MARSLPQSILDALAAPGARPSLMLTSTDLMLRLTRLAATGQAAARTAALLTSAGTILRAACIQAGSPGAITLYRIPNPGTAAQWQAAGTTLAGDAMSSAGVTLAQTGATIRCLWIRNSDGTTVYKDSIDDGQSWGAEQVAVATPNAGDVCTGIAAPTIADVLATWYTFAQAANYITRAQQSGGWSYTSTNTGPSAPVWGAVRGLGADGALPTRVIVGGVQMRTQQTGIAAAAATLAGSTWSAWRQIQPMDTATNGLGHAYPTVHYNAGDGSYYAGINLQDDGSVSGTAQNRLSIWRSSDGVSWTLLQTIGNVISYEGHILWAGGSLYVFDNASVYLAPAALGPVDLSADLLSIEIEEAADEPARLTVILANQDSQYTAIPQLRDNARFILSLGYNGSVVATHIAYIDALEYSSGPHQQRLTIHGRDLLKYLDVICSVFTTFSGQTVAQIATAIGTLANVPLAALPATGQFGQTVPCFTILPGESWLQALRRLGNIYDFSITADGPAGVVKLTERAAGDAASYAYDQHALGISWQRSSDQPNIVRVVGASAGSANVFAEAIDTANLLTSGAHRYRHIVDRLCDSSAKCLLKAQLALRDDQTRSQSGALTVSLNPMHELLDVIVLTDARVGLNAQHARIHAISTSIDWANGAWTQELTLRLP